MMVVTEFESHARKQMGYNLRYYPSIDLDELIKTRNNFSQDSGWPSWDLKQTAPEYTSKLCLNHLWYWHSYPPLCLAQSDKVVTVANEPDCFEFQIKGYKNETMLRKISKLDVCMYVEVSHQSTTLHSV